MHSSKMLSGAELGQQDPSGAGLRAGGLFLKAQCLEMDM